jgi:hypothetical protein
MTDNKKIAEWLGYKVVAGSVFLFEEDRGWYRHGALPDFENSNAAAIELLPVLVEKGYMVNLMCIPATCHQYCCGIMESSEEPAPEIERTGETISAAITSAIIALIEKGEQG